MADFWGISAMVPYALPAGAAAESTLQQVRRVDLPAPLGPTRRSSCRLKLEADLINGQLVFVSKAQLFSDGGRDGCWKAHDAGTANFFWIFLLRHGRAIRMRIILMLKYASLGTTPKALIAGAAWPELFWQKRCGFWASDRC